MAPSPANPAKKSQRSAAGNQLRLVHAGGALVGWPNAVQGWWTNRMWAVTGCPIGVTYESGLAENGFTNW